MSGKTASSISKSQLVVFTIISSMACASVSFAGTRDLHPDVVGVTQEEAKLRVALVIGELAEVARHLDDLSASIAKAREGAPLYRLDSLQHLRYEKEKTFMELRNRLEAELRRYGHLLEGFVFDWRWFEGQRSEIAQAFFQLDQTHVDFLRPRHESSLVASVFGSLNTTQPRDSEVESKNAVSLSAPPSEQLQGYGVGWRTYVLVITGFVICWYVWWHLKGTYLDLAECSEPEFVFMESDSDASLDDAAEYLSFGLEDLPCLRR